ncbi:beta-ketoacyl synthase N-terminal-like domain-containing protein [Dyella sp. GSA-30]|uniref:beta-ketoacyl synthase N-terminal-like domain-containing protein n=1 Tax=Dyella sp. GSA-30 TaxID=2994496 RepID=UPI00248FF60E|nr:beta-ketoacyl synthase N-terminal-like domain-containing protein [Dyella sp. GSA-30]BDU18885.1 polyketide synthase [Dyella sp. GSA-30]
MQARPHDRDVAITGMAALFPGASDLSEFWSNIVNGVDSTGPVPPGRWLRGATDLDDTLLELPRCRRGGFISPIHIDPIVYGIAPNDLDYIEPDQLIALKLAADALMDAGLPQQRTGSDRIGVILGRGGYLAPGATRYEQKVKSSQQIVHALRTFAPGLPDSTLMQMRETFLSELGHSASGSVIGLVPNLAASRIANRLNLHGPAYTVDAACASSLVAIDQAIRLLRENTCDVVIAGGIHHCHDLSFWKIFETLGALSSAQSIRPFDAQADGLLIGEGTGVIVLRRAIDAAKEGDRIYAVIKGSAVSSDGRGASLMSPQPQGQIRALRSAWSDAGWDPLNEDSVDLIEAHGTATPSGDEAELRTLAAIFGPAANSHAVLGSIKSMIGHAMPAAGVAAVIKTALALYYGVFPPSLHCRKPNKLLSETRFKVIEQQMPWIVHGNRQHRRAGVNAFGFGGINAHLVMQSWESICTDTPLAHQPTRAAPSRVTIFQAATREKLEAALQQALHGDIPPPAPQGNARVAILDPTTERIRDALDAVIQGRTCRGQQNVWHSPVSLADGNGRLKTAFIFPGLDTHLPVSPDEVAAYFRLNAPDMTGVEASDVLAHARVVLDTGLLFNAALQRLDVRADAVAGHSIGELTAFTASGGLSDIEVTRRLYCTRSFTFPSLAYVAVSMSIDAVRTMLESGSWGNLVISHENASKQTTVCGTRDVAELFIREVKKLGYFAQILPFVSGLHTPMFESHATAFLEGIDNSQIRKTRCPIWSATTTARYPDRPKDIIALMRQHLVEPVRFSTMIRAMHEDGFRAFVQVGMGQLAALVDDTLRGLPHMTTSAASRRYGGLEQLQRLLLDMWSNGAQVNPLAFNVPDAATPSSLPLDLDSGLISIHSKPDSAVYSALSSAQGNGISPLTLTAPAKAFAQMLDRAKDDLAQVIRANERSNTRKAAPPTSIHVSMDALPFLRDHSLVKQSDACSEDAERWPVVPGTLLIEWMWQHAAVMRNTEKVIAIEDIQFNRWMEAIPSKDIPVDVQHTSAGKVAVKLGDYCQAVFVFGHSYIEAPQSPRLAQCDPCEMPAAAIYEDRWMFHGPSFRGIDQLVHCGNDHILGRIRVLPLPGATLDNMGQLLGYLIMLRLEDRSLAFPHRIAKIEIHSDAPSIGSFVDCLVHSLTADKSSVYADIHASVGTAPWLTIKRWTDHRFSLDSKLRSSTYFPELYPVATINDDGWSWLSEHGSDASSREVLSHYQLAKSEREYYTTLKTHRQRQWLLGRIAAKDAVRDLLWKGGERDIYPAEIIIKNDSEGAPFPKGQHGRVLPPLHLSIAHVEGLAVALCRTREFAPGGVGIDVEKLRPVDQGLVASSLTPTEADMIRQLAKTPADADLMFWRFWTAKEAVSKLDGLGLRYQSGEIVVTSFDETMLQLSRRRSQGIETRHSVAHRLLRSDESSDAAFVVSWTIDTENLRTS